MASCNINIDFNDVRKKMADMMITMKMMMNRCKKANKKKLLCTVQLHKIQKSTYT